MLHGLSQIYHNINANQLMSPLLLFAYVKVIDYILSLFTNNYTYPTIYLPIQEHRSKPRAHVGPRVSRNLSQHAYRDVLFLLVPDISGTRDSIREERL